jgi:hypothetical protein
MTRVKYTKVNNVIQESNKFLISHNQIISVKINVKTFKFSIVNQNSEILFQEECSNLRACKAKARDKLKEIGAKLFDEVRK